MDSGAASEVWCLFYPLCLVPPSGSCKIATASAVPRLLGARLVLFTAVLRGVTGTFLKLEQFMLKLRISKLMQLGTVSVRMAVRIPKSELRLFYPW